ncbi:putative ribonuclease H-like domain-containing protein [Tanacetum coccineum]
MKNQGTPEVKGKNWNKIMERELGEGYFFIKKKFFVCGSLSHLIKDCDFYEKKMARKAELKKQRVFNTSKGVAKPVRNNANRVNHFVPRPVQLNAVRSNVNTSRANVNTVKANINFVRKNVNSLRTNINTVRSKQLVPINNTNSFSPEVNFDSGCSGHMTGNKDHLDDFEECKGGSVTFGGSKGYITGKGRIRVVTKKVEVNLHVNFLEEKSNVKGVGYRWMFDIDYLTDSLNYIPVSLENQSNPHAGTSKVTNSAGTLPTPNANASEEEDVAEELIIVPTVVKHTAAKVGPRMSSTNSKEEEFLTEFQNLKTQENEAFSTGISEDTPKVLAFRKELDELVQKHLREVPKNKATSTNSNNSGSRQANTQPADQDDSDMPELTIFKNLRKGFLMRLLMMTREEPKKISEALKDNSWVEAMQEELLQFRLQQEEGIDYDEVFTPVAKIEAIRLFLAFASFIGFIVYQMDVKSVFLYGTIDEEVYVSQPPGFVDPDHLKKVYKVVKALYGLHQAHRAWYATLSTFLEEHGYRRGTIDKTLFIKKDKKDFMLVQLYVDDIIFGSTRKSWCDKFEALMKGIFQMSSMGELIFFLGLQVNPKVSHLLAMKRIFKYLKSKPNLGLWYPRESPFDLEAFSNSDYGVSNLDRKSITGGCQFLRQRLISWQCKKQTIVATSTTEAEYVAAANCCGQVLWVQNQLLDYGFNFMNTKIHIDNESTICIIKNPVYHSKTKHIEIHHHFIRDCYEKKLIRVKKIHTDLNVTHLLTKPFDGPRNSMDLQMKGSLDDVTLEIKATIDTIEYTITEPSIRSKLQIADASGITMLPNDEIFEGMGHMGGFRRVSRPLLPAMLSIANPSAGQEPLPVTQPQPSSSVVPPTPPSTQPIPSEATTIPPFFNFCNTTHSVEATNAISLTYTFTCTTRIDNLEKQLKETKQTFGKAILTLVERVKTLEVALKRKTKRILLSDSEEEEIEAQGRKFHGLPSLVSLFQELVILKGLLKVDKGIRLQEKEEFKRYAGTWFWTLKEVKSAFRRKFNTSGIKVSASIKEINAGSLDVNTGSDPVTIDSIRASVPSPNRGRREGKAPMTEEEETQASKKTKEQIL